MRGLVLGGGHRQGKSHADGLGFREIGDRGVHHSVHVHLSAALLLQGEWPLLVQACITSIIGVLVLSGGLQGYFIARARMWERLVLLASGLLLIDTGGFTDIIGICLTVFICLLQLNRRRRNIAPAMPA